MCRTSIKINSRQWNLKWIGRFLFGLFKYEDIPFFEKVMFWRKCMQKNLSFDWKTKWTRNYDWYLVFKSWYWWPKDSAILDEGNKHITSWCVATAAKKFQTLGSRVISPCSSYSPNLKTYDRKLNLVDLVVLKKYDLEKGFFRLCSYAIFNHSFIWKMKSSSLMYRMCVGRSWLRAKFIITRWYNHFKSWIGTVKWKFHFQRLWSKTRAIFR